MVTLKPPIPPSDTSALPKSSSRKDAEQPFKALAWMIASGLGFTLMSIFVKRLAPVFPQFELVFFRSLINCLFAAFMMMRLGESFFPSGKPLLVFRGLMGFTGITCFFYSLTHLPLPISVMINWSSPVFVIFFSWVLLKERLNPKVWSWVGLAFVGLVLLLKPDSSEGAVRLPTAAVLIAFGGAAAGGLAYVAVRAATARVGVNTIVFYFTFISTVLSVPFAIRGFVTPSLYQGFELALLGGGAALGQLGMTQGYRFAQAGLVSSMGLLNAVFAALSGWLIFDERLLMIQWFGMLLLGIGVLMSARKGAVPGKS